MTRARIVFSAVAAIAVSMPVGPVSAAVAASTEGPSGDIDIDSVVPGEGTFALAISYECAGLGDPWLLGYVDPLGFDDMAVPVDEVTVVCDGEEREAEFEMVLDASRIRRHSKEKGELGVQLRDGDTVIAQKRQSY
ncbi:hypothetical protein [Nocardia wallacei]|uniref:hypothetical protein n=1 Tax=Nocardia wallacei TaxID=480035 RepID=UPI0024549102|nr:hypothetical protein [Nocardia wallacei]